MFSILDSDTLDLVLRQFSGTMYELSMACVCREFRDILKKMRSEGEKIRTSIAWIVSSENTIMWVLSNYGEIPYPTEVSNIAASQGLLRQLMLIGSNFSEKTCSAAASNGHLHILKWLRMNRCPWNKYTAVSAAAGGHTDLLYWARTNGCEWDEDVCTAAAGGVVFVTHSRYRISATGRVYTKTRHGGHLSTLIWLIENGCPVDYYKVVVAAIHNNHIHILEWIRQNKKFDIETDPFLCDEAAQGGHVDVFAYLLSNGVQWVNGNDWDSTLNCTAYMPFLSAATRGYVDIMDYALRHGCPLPSERWSHSICNIGAYYGHIEVVKWGCRNGTMYDESTCSQAAAGGHMDILIWLRENGCPWNESTCWQCANFGQLEILKWARENGCPWNEDTFSAAAGKGDMVMIEWLYDNGCPWDEKSCAMATTAGNLDALIWLRERGCPWDSSTYRAAIRQEKYLNNGHILKWVKDNDCPEL